MLKTNQDLYSTLSAEEREALSSVPCQLQHFVDAENGHFPLMDVMVKFQQAIDYIYRSLDKESNLKVGFTLHVFEETKHEDEEGLALNLNLNEIIPMLTFIDPWSDEIIWQQTFEPDAKVDMGGFAYVGDQIDALINHFMVEISRKRSLIPVPVIQDEDELKDSYLCSVDGFLIAFSRSWYHQLYGEPDEEEKKDIKRRAQKMQDAYENENYVTGDRRTKRQRERDRAKENTDVKAWLKAYTQSSDKKTRNAAKKMIEMIEKEAQSGR